ncbi:MAG: 30S ribosomal protein S6 [Candidatus Nealsonbacteria bacterium]|nr:30S ribosomal protein S6 [Candidatus Nealsonbacteria bacterium]
MKKYELTYLVSPELNEEEIESIQSEIYSIIEKDGEILNKGFSPLKKDLNSEIEGKKRVFLITVLFNAEPEKIALLEKHLKEEKAVMRHIFLAKKKNERERKKRSEEYKTEEVVVKNEEAPVKKVNIKEIDKKIEEILND